MKPLEDKPFSPIKTSRILKETFHNLTKWGLKCLNRCSDNENTEDPGVLRFWTPSTNCGHIVSAIQHYTSYQILPTRATTRTPRKTLRALQTMCMNTMETRVMARLDSLCRCLLRLPLRIWIKFVIKIRESFLDII